MKKFFRSVVFGILLGFLAVFFLKAESVETINLGVLYGVVVVFERALTEFIKAYIREEPQDKYKIPSTVHMLGRVVEGRGKRLLTGLVFGLGSVLLTLLVFSIGQKTSLGRLFGGMVFGLAGGLLVAVGGCLKDAPIEGFDVLKFMRSPVISAFAGILLSHLSGSYGVVLLSSIGVERMVTELYKSFFRPASPGKFKSEKPVYETWLQRRRIFVIPYAVSWLAFLVFFAFSLRL
ncbi:MAG: hypothetical protein FJY77_00680 [Candidatus Altiarchaeales archaeon]|nr:hypothetical protein [Candidatus Altiarchaeales archaeon]